MVRAPRARALSRPRCRQAAFFVSRRSLGSTVNGTPDVTLLSGVQADGLQRVRFSRKLVSADKCDRSFTNATALVWATGPITQGGARLVVNTHASGNTPGVSGHAPGATYAATRFDFTAPTGIAAACKVRACLRARRREREVAGDALIG